MQVIKRNGQVEKVSFDKISDRLTPLCEGLDPKYIDPLMITKDTITNMYDKISTKQIDSLSADICASKIYQHPDFNKISARICISSLHKQTDPDYFNVVKELYTLGLVSEKFYDFVEKNKTVLQLLFDYSRDYLFDFFGFKTLERSYLHKNKSSTDQHIIERPQHMWMRVSIQIHGLHEAYCEDKIKLIGETYDMLSQHYFTHATPTLFNSGSVKNQLSSCFLMSCDDSIEDIFKTVSDMAKISKWAGGIGVHISSIRGKGTLIKGTNGLSDGIVPLAKTMESVMRYINQGGRRNGSAALYMEPYHTDIFEFIELRKNTGDENLRARDLFLALWIPDLFMQRVQDDGIWSLMCPNKCPNLNETYGSEFETLYTSYESKGMFNKQVQAKTLWKHILESQIETGMPYILFKDHVNKKSNQQNIGVIKSSNLCVTGDTKILTEYGWKEIMTFENKKIKLWNGYEWSDSLVMKTSDSSRLMKIKMSDGTYIKCTEQHQFIVKRSVTKIDASLLCIGDIIGDVNSFPVIKDGQDDFKYPYTSGFFTGDGSYDLSDDLNDKVIWLYGGEKKLVSYIDGSPVYDENNNVMIRVPRDIPCKFTIPEHQNINIKLEWFSGLLDASGYIANNCIQLSSTNKKFIYNLKLFCQTLGINPDVGIFHLVYHRMCINSSDTISLYNIGLKTRRLRFCEKTKTKKYVKNPVTVMSIKYLSKEEPTWCFGEPLRKQGMFNGILTGNCAEILEFSSKEETAVCNLGSLCLPKFVEEKKGEKFYNYDSLREVTKILAKNLNKVIDVNFYPIPETKFSNMKNRPIGIGVQGLADVYCQLRVSFDSKEAKDINKKIFEHIYFASIEASVELSEKDGAYDSFKGSPFSNGILQWEMWGIDIKDLSPELDWKGLIEKVKLFGTRNSLLTALMPTASTSQIMKNTECFEPYSSNIYVRKTLAGEYVIVNEHLVNDLLKLGLWNKDMYNEILYFNGSIQQIKGIPDDIKILYKTAFELRQVELVKQSIDRGPFIDQTQSLNIFQAIPDFSKLSSSHFYGWKNGLKTGMYYLRTQPAVDAIKFGMDANFIKKMKEKYSNTNSCTYVKKGLPVPEGCVSCSG